MRLPIEYTPRHCHSYETLLGCSVRSQLHALALCCQLITAGLTLKLLQ